MSHTSERKSRFNEIVNIILSMERGAVLDIPAGNLWLTKILSSNGFCCTADDICYQTITEKMKKISNNLNISYGCSNLDKSLRYADQSFDYIITLEGLEHIANPYIAISEFKRILKKTGKLFITIPNTMNITSRVRFLLNGDFSAFPHIALFGSEEMPRHLHLSPLFVSQFCYVCGEIGLRISLIKPFNVVKKRHMLIFSPLLPLLYFSHLYLMRNYKNVRIKRLIQSKSFLTSKSIFFILEHRGSMKNTKSCIGDYGFYPSIGIK